MHLLFLEGWWGNLSGLEQFIWGISIISTVLFTILFVLNVIGIEFGVKEHSNDIIEFNKTLFSVNSVIVFLTFAGWTAAYLMKTEFRSFYVGALSSLSGYIGMYLLFQLTEKVITPRMRRNYQIKNMIDKIGIASTVIPANKLEMGKVKLSIQGTPKEFEAVSEGKAIPEETQVFVVDVLDNGSLIVEPVNLNFLD